MRLWSLHPRLLDARGLVALWREGLLARAVLNGQTRGYRHHPQLERFRRVKDPIAMLDAYLAEVAEEASARGYSFDASKLGPKRARTKLTVTRGQLAFEWQHLLTKLERRSPDVFARVSQRRVTAHPRLRVVPGKRESWERTEE